MTDREELAERLDAVEETLADTSAQPSTEREREAIRAALAWRYDNYDAIDPDAPILAGAVEHVADPHATTLREMLARGDA
jgi:hypothetical protein